MRTEVVYLPGDRLLYELARATARDSRPTPLEEAVARAAYTCCYYKGSFRWDCSDDEPCVYCLDVRRLTS